MKPSFRCSELDRVLTCHASKRLAALFPNASGAAAHEGNWCHWKAARTLVDEQDAHVGDGGLPDTPEVGDFKPNGFSEFVVDFFLSDVLYETPGMGIIVEDELESDFGDFILTGHSDVLAFNAEGTEAIGWDLKAGSIPVDAADQNNQMLGYIVLVFLNYPGVQKITWKVCQPKNNPDDGFDRITEVTIEGDDLRTMVDYLAEQLRAVIKNPNFINSEDNYGHQCKYCPAALKCPAFKQDVADMKTTLTEEAIAAIDPNLSVEELMFYKDAETKFRTPFSKVGDALKEKLAAEPGEESTLPDGRTVFLKPRKGNRKWIEGEKGHALTAFDGQGFDADTRAKVIDLNFGALERAIAKQRDVPMKTKKEDKDDARKILDREFGQFFEQPEGQTIAIR